MVLKKQTGGSSSQAALPLWHTASLPGSHASSWPSSHCQTWHYSWWTPQNSTIKSPRLTYQRFFLWFLWSTKGILSWITLVNFWKGYSSVSLFFSRDSCTPHHILCLQASWWLMISIQQLHSRESRKLIWPITGSKVQLLSSVSCILEIIWTEILWSKETNTPIRIPVQHWKSFWDRILWEQLQRSSAYSTSSSTQMDKVSRQWHVCGTTDSVWPSPEQTDTLSCSSEIWLKEC